MNTWARQLRTLLAQVRGPTEVTCRMFDGQHLRVVLPEIVATDLYLHGAIEPGLTQVLVDRCRPGMVFFDVGAQYGYFALLASRLVGPTGRVVAFEPSRGTARLLRENVGHLDNVIVEGTAVTDRAGTATLLDFGSRRSAINTVLGNARVPPRERTGLDARTYDVAAVSLDEYAVANDVRPDIVKLDAEGAELSILECMPRLLRDATPLVAIETGDYEGMASPPTSACIELLERSGYRAFKYEQGLRRHQRRASYGYGTLFFLAGS